MEVILFRPRKCSQRAEVGRIDILAWPLREKQTELRLWDRGAQNHLYYNRLHLLPARCLRLTELYEREPRIKAHETTLDFPQLPGYSLEAVFTLGVS